MDQNFWDFSQITPPATPPPAPPLPTLIDASDTHHLFGQELNPDFVCSNCFTEIPTGAMYVDCCVCKSLFCAVDCNSTVAFNTVCDGHCIHGFYANGQPCLVSPKPVRTKENNPFDSDTESMDGQDGKCQCHENVKLARRLGCAMGCEDFHTVCPACLVVDTQNYIDDRELLQLLAKECGFSKIDDARIYFEAIKAGIYQRQDQQHLHEQCQEQL